jgi:hypothetical protein
MKTRYSALTTLVVVLAIVCSCRSGSIGSSSKDIKNIATTEKASFIEADIKSHISIMANKGILVNHYYVPMRDVWSFVEVNAACEIRDGEEDHIDCLHTLTYLTETDGKYLKKWSISDIEGDMVIFDETKDYIYFFSKGCCAGPNSIKIYDSKGIYLGEALGSIGVSDLRMAWRVSENNNTYINEVLLGVNDVELFMIDKESGIIYKSKLPDDISLRFPTVKFADNDTISLYTFNKDECEVEAFFKINKEKKVLTHKETKVVYCSKTDSK